MNISVFPHCLPLLVSGKDCHSICHFYRLLLAGKKEAPYYTLTMLAEKKNVFTLNDSFQQHISAKNSFFFFVNNLEYIAINLWLKINKTDTQAQHVEPALLQLYHCDI